MTIERLTEEQRRTQVVDTGGEPLLEFGGARSPYVEYGEIDALLSLQRPRSSSRHELLFISADHVMEILFKLIAHELTHAQRELRADDVAAALVTFSRVVRAQELLVKAWDVVATLSSDQFLEFRDELGSASGFQSPGHRKLEFLLGAKDRTMLRPHEGSPAIHADLERRLSEPSVYDDALEVLARRGFGVAREHLERDLSLPYVPHVSVEDAWLRVHAECAPSDDLRRMADALLDIADLARQWRHRHLLIVERIIGYKPGTGGTTGVEWLRRVSRQDVFPELWTMRTRM